MGLGSRISALANRTVASLRRSGAVGALDERIVDLRTKLDGLPAGSSDRAPLLNDLGNRLRDRYLAAGGLADLDAAIASYGEALAASTAADDRAFVGGNLAVAYGDRYTRTGNLADLEAAIDLGRRGAAEAAPGSTDQAWHLGNLANVLHERYYRTHDEADLREAVAAGEQAIANAPTGSPQQAAAMTNLGICLLERNANGEDRPDRDRAVELLESATAMLPAGWPHHETASSALSTARLWRLRQQVGQDIDTRDTRSIAELRRIIARSPEGSMIRHAAQHSIGAALWRQYQQDEEEETLEAAIEAFQAAVAASPDGAGELPLYLNDLGIALSERTFRGGSAQGIADAIAAWNRALRVLRDSFAAVPLGYKLGQQRISAGLGIAERSVAGYLWLVEAIVTQEGKERQLRNAMWTAESTKSRLLAERIGRADLPDPPGVEAGLLARERGLAGELRALDTAELVEHATTPTTGAQQRAARRTALHRELDEVWTGMSAAGPAAAGYVDLRRGQGFDWDAVTGLADRLGPGTALLSMFMTNSRTLVFTLRSGTPAPAVSEVDIDREGWLDVLRRFDREVGAVGRRTLTWYHRLRPLFEAVATNLDGVERVVLAPLGWGLRLPWSVVAEQAGWRGPDGGPMPIVTVEALGLLPLLLDRPRAAAGPAVVVGNPTGDLAHAESEARSIAGMLGVTPLLGGAATKEQVLRDLRAAPVAHLAAHARFDEGTPLDSGVLLADGRLTAREILAESTRLDLLVLSGCETGATGSLGGYELAGLTQAFLQAGVRCLVVSLWRVDDPATATLMRSFYENWRAGMDLAQALSRATGPPAARAPFILSGDWSSPWPAAVGEE